MQGTNTIFVYKFEYAPKAAQDASQYDGGEEWAILAKYPNMIPVARELAGLLTENTPVPMQYSEQLLAGMTLLIVARKEK